MPRPPIPEFLAFPFQVPDQLQPPRIADEFAVVRAKMGQPMAGMLFPMFPEQFPDIRRSECPPYMEGKLIISELEKAYRGE